MEGAASGAMSAVITKLTSTLTVDSFFGVIGECVPFLVIIVPVALGLRTLRKLVKGAGKGKVSF